MIVDDIFFAFDAVNGTLPRSICAQFIFDVVTLHMPRFRFDPKEYAESVYDELGIQDEREGYVEYELARPCADIVSIEDIRSSFVNEQVGKQVFKHLLTLTVDSTGA